MSFGPTAYFCGVDTYEALAHEMAYVHLTDDGSIRPGSPALRDLPFRRLVGDPFNFARRPILLAIDTLTIRNGAMVQASYSTDATRVASPWPAGFSTAWRSTSWTSTTRAP
jgi:hypothetical protein